MQQLSTYDKFLLDWYAPGGLGSRLPHELFGRMYRQAEIAATSDPEELMCAINHHAAEAWKIAADFHSRGYCPRYIVGLDSYKALCNTVAAFPEELRHRLDAVLDGLRQHPDIDPDGQFEERFMIWQRKWYDDMQTATLTADLPAKGRYKQRLALVRNAARVNYPELIAWFNDLRNTVYTAGMGGGWLWGDGLMEKAETEPAIRFC